MNALDSNWEGALCWEFTTLIQVLTNLYTKFIIFSQTLWKDCSLRKSDKPTKLQIDNEFRRLGIIIPPTDWMRVTISIYLGWPRANPDRVRLLKEWQERWIGKHVVGGASKLAPWKYQGRSGTVVAIMPRTPGTQTHLERERILQAAQEGCVLVYSSYLIGLIRWDGGSLTTHEPLCYFSIDE